MVASTSPFLTIWPSLNSTAVSTPDTCGCTVTLASGVTVPSASSCTGMSACRATAVPTVLEAGPPPPARPPGPPPPGRPAPAPGPPAPGAGDLERCTRYQAPPPRATNRSRASRLPTQRRRRAGGWVGDTTGGRGSGGVWESMGGACEGVRKGSLKGGGLEYSAKYHSRSFPCRKATVKLPFARRPRHPAPAIRAGDRHFTPPTRISSHGRGGGRAASAQSAPSIPCPLCLLPTERSLSC
ncbi:hypothetical protein D3C72_1403690 [compost metagenome]